METDEIVKALRCCVDENCDKCGLFGLCNGTFDSLTHTAANALESQQARIAEVEAKLAESQRRERVAVKDIEKMMRICEKGACHFCADGDCAHSPYCEPKWRGPQAWEGDAE